LRCRVFLGKVRDGELEETGSATHKSHVTA
jgi:hypothetical protein